MQLFLLSLLFEMPICLLDSGSCASFLVWRLVRFSDKGRAKHHTTVFLSSGLAILHRTRLLDAVVPWTGSDLTRWSFCRSEKVSFATVAELLDAFEVSKDGRIGADEKIARRAEEIRRALLKVVGSDGVQGADILMENVDENS